MLFDGMKGMGRVFQGAATVNSLIKPGLLEKAAEAGLRSIFVGFENLDANNLCDHGKVQNLGRDYNAAVRRVHQHGVMVNGSFVFGMDEDGPDVFDRTADWAVSQGIETATFHVMTPYPGTALFQRMEAEGRLLHRDWDLYDTRHTVFRPARMTPEQLENGYWHAYGRFYEWGNILKGAMTKDSAGALRHIAYAGGWKKFEWVWHALIRMKQAAVGLPLLERALDLTRPPRHAVRARGGEHAPAPVPALPPS